MSSLDPAAFPKSPKDLGRWQKWVEDRLKYLGSSRSLVERGSVAGGVVTVREILIDPGKGRDFWEDTATATADGAPVEVVLTYLPRPHSEHLYWNTDYQLASEWTREGLVVTFTDPHIKVGDEITVEYAYDPTDATAVPGPVIVSPASGSSTSDTTPTVTGTAAGRRTVEVFVDGSSIGTTTAATDGSWSITAGTLALGGHTATAVQTNPDHSTATSATVSFSVVSPAPATATARDTWVYGWGTISGIGGAGTPIALPASTEIGDLIVVSAICSGPGTINDPRLTYVGNCMWIGWATDLSPVVAPLGGAWYAFTCATFATNASGWTAAHVSSNTSIADGGTIATPVVSGVSAAICATTANIAGFGTCSISTPTGYTNVATVNHSLSSGINLWTSGGIGSSPVGTVTYSGDGAGSIYATVIGLIGP